MQEHKKTQQHEDKNGRSSPAFRYAAIGGCSACTLILFYHGTHTAYNGLLSDCAQDKFRIEKLYQQEAACGGALDDSRRPDAPTEELTRTDGFIHDGMEAVQLCDRGSIILYEYRYISNECRSLNDLFRETNNQQWMSRNTEGPDHWAGMLN